MFFKMLDLDEDGFLSRSDLNKAAKRLGWSWHEAPLLAVLDLLSISKPIPKSEFIALIHKVVVDLSMSGARTKNYISSPAFNGHSAVESAVVQMLDEGVQVVQQVKWN